MSLTACDSAVAYVSHNYNPSFDVTGMVREILERDYKMEPFKPKPFKCDPMDAHTTPRDLMPKQIIHNADAVIVFWKDGSKTIVRRREGDPDDIHSAFAQALTKKLFGATTTVHKMVDKVLKEQEPKKKKEE